MKMLRSLPTTALVLLLALTKGFSQGDSKLSYYDLTRDRNLMLNFGGGIANYFGDFVNPGSLGLVRPNLNIEAEYFLLDRLSLRAELGYLQIAGRDAKADDDRWERNLNFRSNIFEFNTTAALHLYPQTSTFYPRPRLNPFVFAGIGVMHGNPKTQFNGDWVTLQPLQTEGTRYKRTNMVVPFGGGLKYQLNPYWNIIGQVGFRFSFTDHLDDVSIERYPNPATLGSDLARALSDRRAEIGTKPTDPRLGKRGNPEKNDHYMVWNIKFQYYLPVQIFPNRGAKERKSKAAAAAATAAVVAPVVVAPPAPVDTDKDGILDSLDKCPTVPGVPEYQGCPIPDTDGDGVLDPNDKCPTEKGVPEYEGCPIPDTDADGIADPEDLCPKVPGFTQYKGCPEIVLYFKRDVSVLDASDRLQLDSVVTFLKAHPNLNVILEGHTSTLGAEAYNLKLSQTRAENSKKYLVSKGIAAGRITARWYGEQQPIGDNSKEEGRALSRRTVVKLDMEKH